MAVNFYQLSFVEAIMQSGNFYSGMIQFELTIWVFIETAYLICYVIAHLIDVTFQSEIVLCRVTAVLANMTAYSTMP